MCNACKACSAFSPPNFAHCRVCSHIRDELAPHTSLVSSVHGRCVVNGKPTDVRLPAGEYLSAELLLDYVQFGWLAEDYAFTVRCPFRRYWKRYKALDAETAARLNIGCLLDYIHWRSERLELTRPIPLPESTTIKQLKGARTCGFVDLSNGINAMKTRAATLKDMALGGSSEFLLEEVGIQLDQALHLLLGRDRLEQRSGQSIVGPEVVAIVLRADSELREIETKMIRDQTVERLRASSRDE